MKTWMMWKIHRILHLIENRLQQVIEQLQMNSIVKRITIDQLVVVVDEGDEDVAVAAAVVVAVDQVK